MVTFRSLSLAVPAALGLVVCARSSLAESSVGLAYKAPSGCPSEAQFVAAVGARGGLFERAETLGVSRRMDVSIRKAESGFSGTLQVEDDGGASDPRELHAASCAEVMEGLAVVTAIALREDSGVAPPPRAAFSNPPPAAPPPIPSAAPSVVQSPPPAVVADPDDGRLRGSSSFGGDRAGRFVRGGPAKWLLLGALVGGALTAAWFGSGRRANVPSSPVTSSSSSSFARAPALRESEPASRLAPDAAVPSSASGARTASGLASAGRPRHPLSTLAAEVAALDAARNAIAAGAYDEALRVVEQYRRDFPAGELAPDAEVVAMDALAAEGDHAEVARRAERFMGRYPRDPHLAHIRWLADHTADVRGEPELPSSSPSGR